MSRHLRLEPKSSTDPARLHERAFDNLRYIRETMEAAGSFTAISGQGVAAAGLVAVLAWGASGNVLSSPRWLGAWLGAAALAMVITVVATTKKARSTHTPLGVPFARKVALAFLPAILTGVVITAIAVRAGWYVALPGVWLIMYGSAVMAGGALSTPIIPAMGASFMLLGACALGVPVVLSDALLPAAREVVLNVLMVAGFGGLHLLFGWAIARRHGG